MALEAAETLISEQGLAGLSMRKVADSMGYTVGNLYQLFEDQDALLRKVNERTGQALYAHLIQARDQESNPARRLHAVAAAYIDFGCQHPHRWRLIFELPTAPQHAEAVNQRIARMFELVESTLQPVIPHADHTAATLVWAAVHGLCSLAVTGKLAWSGVHSYTALSEALIDTHLAGLAGNAGSEGHSI
jgi:AcrR family transcriptional regulator